MAFTINVQDGDPISTISLSGDLDMLTAPRLHRAISRLLRGGRRRIVVDLAELAFCDSAGLNAFVQGDKHCAAGGGWLRVAHAHGHVARVMELSGVDDVLTYRENGD